MAVITVLGAENNILSRKMLALAFEEKLTHLIGIGYPSSVQPVAVTAGSSRRC